MQLRISVVQKTILVVMSVFFVSLLALAGMVYMQLQSVASAQHQHTQQQISVQVAKLSAPLILRRDLISLNISLNELLDSGAIVGAAIYDANNKMLAKVGILRGSHSERITIRNNELVLGSLQVKVATVDLRPGLQQLLQRTWPSVLIMALLSLVLGWWYGLRLHRPMQALHEAQEQLLLYDRTPPLDDQRLDEWGIINLGFNLVNVHRMLQAQTEQQFELDMPQGTGLPVIPAKQTNPIPDVNFDHELHDLALELSDVPKVGDIDDPLLEGEDSGQKPANAESTRQVAILTMGDLKHGSQPESDVVASVMAAIQANAAEAPAPHDLQMQTQPANANPLVSLLYINFNTSDQEGPIEAEEKHSLLQIYQALVDQVCDIYGGVIEVQDNYDVLVTFDKPLEHMTHCVNALCAGQFFFGLYKAYSQQRQQQGLDNLNLQIVVHTGSLQNASNLIQEVAALSHQPRLDDLIISHQVAYQPELQQRVLVLEHCQDLGNGAFRLARLSSDYQDLLDMQIKHFS